MAASDRSGGGPDVDFFRSLSEELFRKEHVIETAYAVAEREGSFETEWALDRVRRQAAWVDVSLPCRSAVHDSLKRLHRLLALDCTIPKAPRGQAYRWSVRGESPFWPWLWQLVGMDAHSGSSVPPTLPT